MVGVDRQRQVCDRADGAYHLLVTVQSYLDFQNVEAVGALERLLANHFRSVDAYGERRAWRLGSVQTPESPPRLAYKLSDQVVKGNVHCGLGGSVAFGKTVHISQDILHLERVAELLQVHLLEKCAYALDSMAEVRRHGGFAVTYVPVVLYLNLHVGRSRARVRSHCERMLQLQFVREIAQMHLSRPCLPPLFP